MAKIEKYQILVITSEWTKFIIIHGYIYKDAAAAIKLKLLQFSIGYTIFKPYLLIMFFNTSFLISTCL